MKLCVLVPNGEYLAQAGVRIRYKRIAKALARHNVDLTLRLIDDMRLSNISDSDVYLFSKIPDSRSIILAHELRAAGRLIGVDLFDDYFSQHDDSRFAVMRQWLRTIGPLLDFVICSTSRMAEVIRAERPDAPVILLNDPFAAFDEAKLASKIEAKLLRVRADRIVRVAWFGMGDNPHFDLGLKDLASFGSSLRRLETKGYRVELEILTNRRALTASGLEQLRRLGISYRLGEWSEQGEADLLERNFVAFIPVNSQPFSIAKSMNRAVTAISHGAQILSPGYPLYYQLERFIYDDANALIDSIEHGSPLIRRHTLPGLSLTLNRIANPETEAAHLASELRKLKTPKSSPRPILALLHGTKSIGSAHKLAQRMGHLSIATPLCHQSLNFDIIFSVNARDRSLDAKISERTQKRLAATLPAMLSSEVSEGGYRTIRLKVADDLMQRLMVATDSLGGRIAAYPDLMAACDAVTKALLPKAMSILSELQSPLQTRPVAAVAVPVAMPRRILFIANAPVPSLAISFIRPLQKLVDEQIVTTRILLEADLKAHVTPRRSSKSFTYYKSVLDEFKPEVIIFCRYSGPFSSDIIKYAKTRDIGLIYHLDDDLLDIPESIGVEKHNYHMAPARIISIRSLLAAADIIYCSTEALKARMIEYGFNDRLIHGEIYCAGTIRRIPEQSKHATIGYMGGRDHAADLALATPAIRKVLEKNPDVRFELFGTFDLPTELEGLADQVTLIPPIADYEEFLRVFASMQWDIGLCPLIPSNFNRVKANTKWIEYTAVGTAVVASGGMAYDRCCADGCGILANNDAEWSAALEKLVRSPKARHDQTRRAQQKLESEYSEAALLDQLVTIINRVLPGEPLPQDPLVSVATPSIAAKSVPAKRPRTAKPALKQAAITR